MTIFLKKRNVVKIQHQIKLCQQQRNNENMNNKNSLCVCDRLTTHANFACKFNSLFLMAEIKVIMMMVVIFFNWIFFQNITILDAN